MLLVLFCPSVIIIPNDSRTKFTAFAISKYRYLIINLNRTT